MTYRSSSNGRVSVQAPPIRSRASQNEDGKTGSGHVGR